MVRRALLPLVLLLPFFSFAQSLTGSWNHVSDSDGTKPRGTETMQLTFEANGKCHLKATDSKNAAKNVTGDGTYSIRSGRLTLSLPMLELKVNDKPFTLAGNDLTLPFLLFNEGNGTSRWVNATSAPPLPASSPAPSAAASPAMNSLASGAAPQPRPTGGMKNELVCTCNNEKRDTVPEVTKACNVRSGLAGNLMCGSRLQGANDQPCAALKNESFKLIYDQVVLGKMGPLQRGRLPTTCAEDPAQPHVLMVRKIIDTYFKPYKGADFFIMVCSGGEEDMESAHIDQANPKALTVKGAAILGSPGAMISIIGHEMVHEEQLERANRTPPVRIRNLADAMKELEASTWDTATPSRFRWKIGATQTWACETKDEQERSIATRACREWQVYDEIRKLESNDAKNDFATWLNGNPWAQVDWLPYNKNWRTMTSNPKPQRVRLNATEEIDCGQASH